MVSSAIMLLNTYAALFRTRKRPKRRGVLQYAPTWHKKTRAFVRGFLLICCLLVVPRTLHARIMGAIYTEGAYANADHYWAWSTSQNTWRGYFHQSFHTGDGQWIKNYIYDYSLKCEGVFFKPATFRVRWHALRPEAATPGNDLELMINYPFRETWRISFIFNPSDIYLEGGDYVGWGLGKKLNDHSLYLESGLSSGVESPDYNLYAPRPTTPIHTTYFEWRYQRPERLGLLFEVDFNHVVKTYSQPWTADITQKSNHTKWRLGGFLAGGSDGLAWRDNFYFADDLDYLSTIVYYHSPGYSAANSQRVIWNQLRFHNNLHLLWDIHDLYLRTVNTDLDGRLKENQLAPSTSYLPGLPAQAYRSWRLVPGYQQNLTDHLAVGTELSLLYHQEKFSYNRSALRAELSRNSLHRLIIETGHANQQIWFFKFTLLMSLGN